MHIKLIFKEENNIKDQDLQKHKDFLLVILLNKKLLVLFMNQLIHQKISIIKDLNLQWVLKEYQKRII